MKIRKIFWLSVAIFSMIIIGAVLYVGVVSFDRLFPIECNVTEEWIKTKTDFLVIDNFLKNNPNAKFENAGHVDGRADYCTYLMYGDTQTMKLMINGNMEIIRTTVYEN